MGRQYDPSPVQLCLPLDVAPENWAEALAKIPPEDRIKYLHGDFAVPPPIVCPHGAMRHGQDEYRCRVCGVVWGLDEPRPVSSSCRPFDDIGETT